MSQPTGKFVWYELMTTDTAAAAAFYQSVVGWEAKDSGMPGGGYTIFNAGTQGVGGMMAIPDEACAMGVPPSWSGYIWVDDVDAYVGKVCAAGGKSLRPAEDIPGVGRFAVVADPYGAAFMLFKDSGMTSAGAEPVPGTPGHIGWHELHAGDGVGAFAFYSSLFGWTKGDTMDMGPNGVYQLFATGGDAVGGMMTKMPETPAPCWVYYFNVAALDAAVDKVTAGGGKVVMGPMQVPGGSWIVNGIDPQGAYFALVAPKR